MPLHPTYQWYRAEGPSCASKEIASCLAVTLDSSLVPFCRCCLEPQEVLFVRQNGVA